MCNQISFMAVKISAPVAVSKLGFQAKRLEVRCIHMVQVLTLKALNKNCSRRHFNFLLLPFEENKA